jgi:1,2-diacylglycerol 3-alpha-glucosyltransferase
VRIFMFTNVFRPKVGGVTRSVETFTERFMQRGHEVFIVAPSFEGATENEPGVMRVPAMHDVLQDYSLPMAYPGMLQELVAEHPRISSTRTIRSFWEPRRTKWRRR